MSTNQPRACRLQFGSARALPGEKAWGRLCVRQGSKEVRLPVAVVHGAKPGPHVVLLANQHGLELNGLEAVRQFVADVDPTKMRGTIFAIPSANPRATMLRSQIWPEDQHFRLIRKYKDGPYPVLAGDYTGPYNMNHIWPGRTGGRFTERVAYEIWNGAVLAPHRKADLVVDFHCHQAHTTAWADDDMAVPLGVASGVPYVCMTRSWGDLVMCALACARHGIPSLVFELGGQGRIVPESVREGVRAILNLLKFYHMLPGKPMLPRETTIFDPWRSDMLKRKGRRPTYAIVRAQRAGVLVPHAEPHQLVRKGDVICEIVNPYTGRPIDTVRSPRSGGLWSLNDGGVISKGDRLFVVCLAWKVSPKQFLRYNNPHISSLP